jgi:hypothetical protein
MFIGQDGLYKLNGEVRDQVSCCCHCPHGILQISPNNGADVAREQLVATIPTANGGTRKKIITHGLFMKSRHCGGGKCVDIKKLAFSLVGYKTIVDLKIDFFPKRLTFLHYFFCVFYALLFLLNFVLMVT